ncbi:MAG: prepilin-type N-terminal cleavage/methylation domain-containing protein [Gemmatimonadaceae bacterium]|nr:prepilin-type N-terminal cleavage/methylation domain-containing protein [Gemmatimonadaceae bacterium]
MTPSAHCMHTDPLSARTAVAPRRAGLAVARRPRCIGGASRGMTLVEVILAIVILSGTMLGLGNFSRKFQAANTGSTTKTLASDLAAQRIAEVEAYRPYSAIVGAYNGTVEPFAAGTYTGLTRTTRAVRCVGCPTATNDYVTVTVSVTGNDLAAAVTKTTVIAAY